MDVNETTPIVAYEKAEIKPETRCLLVVNRQNSRLYWVFCL